MRRVLSVENMRKSDEATIKGGIPGRELMKRAGQGILEVLSKKDLLNNRILIVCGSGNNAGDGYVLASLLKDRNVDPLVIRISEKASEDGAYYLDECNDKGVRIVFFNEVDLIKEAENGPLLIVDCLLGTGFDKKMRESLKEIIRSINEVRSFPNTEVRVVSVDINSGLNGDTGLYEECIISDLTITIGDIKTGLLLNASKDVCASLENVDIGIEPVDKPYFLFEKADAKACLKKRPHLSNKGDNGYIALVGGSSKYSGAISLAGMANAAMRSGAGVVMIAAPKTLSDIITQRILESTVYPLSENNGDMIFVPEEFDVLIRRVRVIAFGMGIGRSKDTLMALRYILENYKGVLVIDADGLNCLSDITKAGFDLKTAACKSIVLTPHLKEFSRLTGETVENIMNDLIGSALKYAKDNEVIVLLKGPTTTVTDGETAFLIDRGCPGMATAGSGDVLSGIMAAVCGYNDDYLLATATAAYINGYAGELAESVFGEISMIASDTIAQIPKAILDIQKSTYKDIQNE